MSSRDYRPTPLDYAMRAAVAAGIVAAGLAVFYVVVAVGALVAAGLEATACH